MVENYEGCGSNHNSQCFLKSFLVVFVEIPFQTESKIFQAFRVLEREPFPITLHNGLSIHQYSSNCDSAIYFQPSGQSAKNVCDKRDVGKIGPEQIQERIKWWKATAGGNQRHRPWRDSTEHPTPQGHVEHRDHWPCLLTSLRSDVHMTGCRTG